MVITSIRRGVWPGVGIHCTPRFPFRKLATVKNVPEHRSGPSRSDVWRTNLAYRINYTSDGMDSKSQSHTHSVESKSTGITPGKIPRVSQRGGRPGVRRTPGITTAELVPRCVDHSDARGRNDPPPRARATVLPPYISHQQSREAMFLSSSKDMYRYR